MRILFCNYEYPPLGGGGGVINALLAAELARSHDVSVLTSQGLGTPEFEEISRVKIYRVPVTFRGSKATANLPSMAAYMIRGRRVGVRLSEEVGGFDIINTHFALPTGPVGAHISRHTDTPNVLSLLGGDVYDPSKLMSPHRNALLRGWVRGLARDADKVVADSDDIRQRFGQYFDADLNVDVIPLAIKRPAEYPALERAAWGLTQDDVVLISVGRLVRRKAIDQVLDSIADLKNPRIKLLVLGTGPLEPELKKLAAKRGISQQVVFPGFVDEATKFGLLKSADIFISSSQHEGFGLVFLEAMACGLPIICYDRGGQTDFLENGHTGFLLPLNDRTLLKSAIQNLCAEKDTRKKMRELNLKKVEHYFIERCAAQYLNVFEQVISGA